MREELEAVAERAWGRWREREWAAGERVAGNSATAVVKADLAAETAVVAVV